MKKVILLFMLLATAFVVHAQKYKGDSWAKVKSSGSGTLTVVYYSQAGLIYKSPSGEMKGVCADILNDFVQFVQEKYGKKISLNYAGEEKVFSDFLNVVQNTNDVLGVTNVTITEERKKVMKFAPPFLTNPIVLITHKDAPNLKSMDELNAALQGYTAEIIAGSTHVKHMENIKKNYVPSLKITYGPSGSVILDHISKNPKLITILDFTELVDATRRQLAVKRQNVEFTKAEEVAFAMSLKSDWDVVWKEFLTNEYKTSVKYRKYIVDNLGANFLAVIR
jgi:membrane-bound lytic murein transglycosylase MltF